MNLGDRGFGREMIESQGEMIVADHIAQRFDRLDQTTVIVSIEPNDNLLAASVEEQDGDLFTSDQAFLCDHDASIKLDG
jgi:hypothetical protein